jgi:hypothetical protein
MWAIIVGLALLASVSLSGCAGKTWVAIEGVRIWTDQNYKSLLQWEQKVCGSGKPGELPPSPGECATLKTYINPYMNILKHTLAAVEAIEAGNDIELSRRIMIVTRIVVGIGGGFDGLIFAMKTKDLEGLNAELPNIQLLATTNAGIEPPAEKEEPGFIRRAFRAIW